MDSKNYLKQLESFVNNKIAGGMMTPDDAYLFAYHMANNQGLYTRDFELEEAEFKYYISNGSFDDFPYDPFEQVTPTTVL